MNIKTKFAHLLMALFASTMFLTVSVNPPDTSGCWNPRIRCMA